MEILNNMLLAVSKPAGLWANLIDWLGGGIANYAVVIIVMTLMIRSIMIPFDIYNKFVMKRNTQKMAVLKPELDKINKRYANNPNLKNQKTMELYKKENYSIYGTCFGMLIYMVMSMTIFISLFGTLNDMSAYKISQEYNQLQTVYAQAYDAESDADKKVEVAQSAVVAEYKEIKNDFLWIQNIWRPDNWSSVTLSYDQFLKTTKQSKDDVDKQQYQSIMDPIQQQNSGWNGCLILALLSAVLSYSSTKLGMVVSKWRAKRKGLVYTNQAENNKTLLVIMPLIMAMFTLFYTASFGIYIVAGSLFMTIISPLITILVDVISEKIDNKNMINKNKNNRASYSR